MAIETSRRTFITGCALALVGTAAAAVAPSTSATFLTQALANGPIPGFDNRLDFAGNEIYYPTDWYADTVKHSSDTQVIHVCQSGTGKQVGTLTFRYSEALYNADTTSPEEYLVNVVASFNESAHDFVIQTWGTQTYHYGGMPMARACMASLETGEMWLGNVYVALKDDYYLAMYSLLGHEYIEGFYRLIDTVWDQIVWGGTTAEPPVETEPEPGKDGNVSAGGEGDMPPEFGNPTIEELKEQALQDAINKNAQSPLYNPYWDVVDLDLSFAYDSNGVPYIQSGNYIMRTPWGNQGRSDQFAYLDTTYGWEGSGVIYHWAMPLIDSDGQMYYMTSGPIYGYSYICDIAYYPGYSDCWYKADDGTPVYTDFQGNWVSLSDHPAAKWNPRFIGAKG